jgi:hypothetical protein
VAHCHWTRERSEPSGVLARTRDPLPGIPRSCAKKFSEPGALSSATPTDFRLPPTASRSGLDLLASRARCKGESRAPAAPGQGAVAGALRKLRRFLFDRMELRRAPFGASATDVKGERSDASGVLARDGICSRRSRLRLRPKKNRPRLRLRGRFGEASCHEGDSPRDVTLRLSHGPAVAAVAFRVARPCTRAWRPAGAS